MLRLGAALLILLAIAYLLLDTIARDYAEREITRETGLVATIEAVRIGVFHPGVTIKNFKLYNATNFGNSEFIELPELHVEYDLAALANNKFHSRSIRLNLAQINIVQDAAGHRNLEAIGRQLQKSVENLPQQTHEAHAHKSGLEFTSVDKVELTLGTIRFVQLTQPPQTNDFVLNVNHQIFRDIKSEQDLPGLLLTALLKSHANIFASSNGGPGLLELLAPPKSNP